MIFDTHAHYDSKSFDSDRDSLLTDLPNRGVSLVLCPGCDVETSQFSIKLTETYDYIYAGVGIHPQEVMSVKQGDLDRIKTLASHPKVKAIGEIGLDYYWIKDEEEKSASRTLFANQLDIAKEVGLPVIIHDREAHKDCFDMVETHRDTLGVYHCYSGGVEEARRILNHGWMLSFTGVITFPNAKKALEVLEYMPLDRLMLETDAPYMAPVPHRGKRCDSSMIVHMADRVAQIKGVTTGEVLEITLENGKRFFNIP